MNANHTTRHPIRAWLILGVCLLSAACGWLHNGSQTATVAGSLQDYEYLIAPGDTLNVFVWQNPDVSVQNVPVRPDGMISTPLVDDMIASGKTSSSLRRTSRRPVTARLSSLSAGTHNKCVWWARL